MKIDIILYTLSTALSRGSVLIFFPIVSSMLTLAQFGIWSLALVTINLLIPIICLNGPASILREGSENTESVYHLIAYYTSITIGISLFGLALALQLESFFWLKYVIIIAFFEAIIMLFTTALRVFERPKIFFSINLLKTILILIAIIYAKGNNYSLTQLLIAHCSAVFVSFTLVLIYFFYFYYTNVNIKFKILPKVLLQSTLLFSVTLIPHGVSQWLMSSSDRFILEAITNNTELGMYSIAYSLALVLGLLNTAIGLTLPVYVIKNYDNWVANRYDQKYIMLYTLISILFFLAITCIYLLDWKFFKVLKHYDIQIFLIFLILFNGLFILGLYYFVVNYLFYHKKSKLISIATLVTAIVNIGLTIIFSYFIGAVGAALATLLSYIMYLLVVKKLATSVEPNININIYKPICYMMSLSSIITLGVYSIV